MAWSLSFAAILYLALKNGGFDTVISGQVGILVCWGVLLVAAIGLVPRLRPVSWLAIGLLAAFALWTAIGIGGSESQERTVAELGRIATYCGVLTLAFVLQARAGSRHLLNGVATAIAVVTVLAVLSRLHPQWFPANGQADFLSSAARRLSYPLNYWNALSAFMAMGAGLLLGVAATAKSKLGQGLAAGVLPLVVLGTSMAISRGGAIVLVLGVIVYLVLADDRLPKLATALVATAGGLVLVAAESSRDAVQSGVDSPAARSEGLEMIWICLIVCAGVALLHIAINMLARHATRPSWMRISRRQLSVATAIVLVAGLGALLVSGTAADVSDRWDRFKTPPEITGMPSDSDVFARLQDSSGQGRYQYWQAATDAYESDKLAGTGAGTFVLWWARHATVPGPVQDAHSLYAQTLGETGLIGAALLVVFVLLTIAGGVWRTMQNAGDARVMIAAATAAIVVFWADASIEWIWQMPVMPVSLMILAAIVLGQRSPASGASGIRQRVILGCIAVLALVPIAIATTTAARIQASQGAARSGDLARGLAEAQTAARVQPGAMTPWLQQALVLESDREFGRALTLAIKATRIEPTNWKPWVIRARIEARQGRTDASVASFRTAKRLNPRSPVFEP